MPQFFKTPQGAFLTIRNGTVASPTATELSQLRTGQLSSQLKTSTEVFALARTPTPTPTPAPTPAPTVAPTIEPVVQPITQPSPTPTDAFGTSPEAERTREILARGEVLIERARVEGIQPTVPPVAPIDTGVPADGATTPVLPPSTATDTVNAYFTGIQENLDTARKALEDSFKQQLEDLKLRQADAQTKIDELTAQQKDIITEDVQPLLAPFRAELETAERERLFVNENFAANQRLTNELSTLLTQGNALIEQQRAVTGLNVIREPRVAKTMSDISARVGVVQAVLSARNNQIAQAFIMIDRSIEATNADRNDQLNYYNTLLSFYGEQKGVEQTNLISITKDQRTFLNAQIGLLEGDLARAEANAENLKAAMTDPNTALDYAQAGVTLNDSVEQIAQKLAQYGYVQEIRQVSDDLGRQGYTSLSPGQSQPANSETITTTDSRGGQKTWWRQRKDVGIKFETRTIGGRVIRIGFDAQGIEVSRTDLGAAGAVPIGDKVFNLKNLPGDIRNSIIEDLQDEDFAKTSGEISLAQLSGLYSEVNLEALRSLMDEFYDFDSLVADRITGDKNWWEFWK